MSWLKLVIEILGYPLSGGKTKHSFLVQEEIADVHGRITRISKGIFLAMKDQKAAVIDLGTNTFKWLAAKSSQTGFETLYAESQKVNLGEGLALGQLTEASMERGIASLLYAVEKLDQYGISNSNMRVIGTSAIRNATNHKVWVENVKKTTGLEVEVISGDEEAKLIFQGILASGALGQETVLVMDIGGGSVEFIIGHEEGIVWKQSFEIGGNRLRQKFQTSDPISAESIIQLLQYFGSQLEPLKTAIDAYQPQQLVGSSGSFDTLGLMHHLNLGLAEQTYSIKKHEVSLAYFEQVCQKFIVLNRKERLAIPGMIELRVDLIVVGSILIQWVVQHLHNRPILASGYSLKEGLIWEMLSKK